MPKILVVEDEAIVAIDLAHSLTAFGYEVIGTVGSGNDALSIIKKNTPDLVLMDVQLKGDMDGIQVAEQIQKIHRIPIIYLTAYSDPAILSRAKLTEPYGYIMKSFEHNDLHSTIEMALYRHKIELKVIEKEELLSKTFNSISDAVLTLGKEGEIQFLNPAAEKLFNVFLDVVEGEKFSSLDCEFITQEGTRYSHPFQDFSRNQEPPSTKCYLCNIEQASRIPVHLTISPLVTKLNQVSGYVYVIRNLEEEEHIQRIHSRFTSIVESSEDAIIGASLDGRITSWNKGARSIFGYTEDEVKGKNLSLLTPPFYPHEIPGILDQLLSGENIDHYETVRQKKNGEIIDMSIKISPILDPKDEIEGVSLIARDITMRKSLEKELLEIEDRERTRIGQDLHDSLGQQLTGISLQVKALERQLEQKNYDGHIERAKEISSLINEAIKQTKDLAHGLVPVALKQDGLSMAIKELVTYAEIVHQRTINFKDFLEFSINNTAIETQLYHIIQESVNNSVKHAGADSIEIILSNEGTELHLQIIDNGIGINLNTKYPGLGLKIMRYRIEMINGRIEFFTPESGGTVVHCRVPIHSIGRLS